MLPRCPREIDGRPPTCLIFSVASSSSPLHDADFHTHATRVAAVTSSSARFDAVLFVSFILASYPCVRACRRPPMCSDARLTSLL